MLVMIFGLRITGYTYTNIYLCTHTHKWCFCIIWKFLIQDPLELHFVKITIVFNNITLDTQAFVCYILFITQTQTSYVSIYLNYRRFPFHQVFPVWYCMYNLNGNQKIKSIWKNGFDTKYTFCELRYTV